MYKKIRNFSYSKLVKNSKKDSSEDEEIKTIIKEINHDNKKRLFIDYKSPGKIRTFIRSQSTLTSSKIKPRSNIYFIRENQDNSLLFKLKDQITKETLILELRQELNYHIKFQAVYKNLLKKITHLKEMVKDNKEKIEKNTDTLKETFVERFNIIDNYEKTISLLKEEKNELNKSNKEIIKIRQINKEKLIKELNDIQKRNTQQREEIDTLEKKLNELEYQKVHINDELEKKMEDDQKNYEHQLKLYNALCKKHEIFLWEYNSYLKSGDEMTKVEVKLFDDTNTKNSLIEENLEIELSEKLLKKSYLLNNINNLKSNLKVIEERLEEEKMQEEKKSKLFNFRSRMNIKLDIPNKFNKTDLKKSSSYNSVILKKI